MQLFHRHPHHRGLWLAFFLMAIGLPAEADELATYNSRHYVIHTGIDRQEAADLAKHMDLVFAVYKKRFAGFRAKNRRSMSIYLFKDQAAYIRHMASRGINAANSGGMFVPRIPAMFTWVEGNSRSRTLAVLQHEGFHQFAWTYLGHNLPPWANEGLAQYFENGILIEGKRRSKMHLGVVDPMRLLAVRGALTSQTRWVTFEELIDMDGATWSQTLAANPAKSGLLYAYAWSVAHFLVHADGGRYAPAFGKYLQLTANGQPSATAFRKAFGTNDLEPMRKRWEAYTLDLQPDPLSVASQRMRMIAGGLALLETDDQPIPDTLDQLQAALAAIGYQWGYQTHGAALRIEAADPDNFTYTDARGQTRPFELTDPDDPSLPPQIAAPQLKPPARITWTRHPDDSLTSDLTFH